MMTTQAMLMDILDVFEEAGQTVYASVDQKVGKVARETDVWHCCRLREWTCGALVYDNKIK